MLLYAQFVREYIFLLPRSPYFTYVITIIIFCFAILYILEKINKKIDLTLLVYFLCIPLVLINESFLASVNIFGFALYTRSKKNISIKTLGTILFIFHVIILIILIFRICADRELVRVWGNKLDKDIVIHSFNNPNTEAEFFFFCALAFWLIIKNKYLRNLLVLIITIIGYSMTYGRSYMLALLALIISDLFISKKRVVFYKYFLIIIPLSITVLSFIIGYVMRNGNIVISDVGLSGRFFVFGYIMERMDIFKLFFGFKNIMADKNISIPLDVSVFAIFATRGIVMLIFLLLQYIKYIKNIKHYYKYVPAIISIVIAGIALPMMAWFSINMVLFICLAEHQRKINNEFNNNYCSHI
jgi:hypothetical protein